MKRFILITAICFFSSLFVALPARADYPATYRYYMELGKRSLNNKQYEKAIEYFQYAQAVSPGQSDSLSYLNLAKRLKEGRVQVFNYKKKSSGKPAPVIPQRRISEIQRLEEKVVPQKKDRTAHPVTPVVPSQGKVIVPEKTLIVIAPPDHVILDNELWSTQPKTTLRIELNKSVILEGQEITHFLIITPDFIKVETIDRDHLKIKALKRGLTFLHVWDDQGRWTFNIEVILPIQKLSTVVRERTVEEFEEPFKFAYSADWGSYYLGQSFEEMQRQNLTFVQWAGMYGKTPYGDFDTGFTYNKFQESTELIGQTVGLTNGHIGDFKDFTIRGYDASSYFSALTLPGQYFRGILVKSPAFNHLIDMTYLQGQNRSTFGYLAAGTVVERQSYIEGARVTLFPREQNQYSVNFARGYGEARENYLKDRVVSLEAKRRIGPSHWTGEVAYDENDFAETIGTQWQGDNYNLNLSARNIDKNFTTITSAPSNQGEAGGTISADFKFNDISVNSFLDLYRDRFLPNADHPEAVNLDFNTSLNVPVSKTEDLRFSLFYLDTPGELSPRQNLRANSTYSKRWLFLPQRSISTSLGATYQQSRFDLSSASEYDRYSLTAGINIPVMDNLSYYANYEYSWVDEILSGDRLRPSVLTTGLNYSRKLTDHWSGNANLYYRDEERTEGQNSFLAGEDSLTSGLGVSYRPTPDFEFFVDTSYRNVWAESATNTAFNDLDIRSGVRSAWEIPFSWSPKGTIRGVVFKDLNGNHIQDEGETGIPNALVKIGRQAVMTDRKGYYELKVRAKRVDVALDSQSIPEGFVFLTPNVVDVKIEENKVREVDFGLTTQSGIYGTVFYDRNGNGKPDPDDMFIPHVQIILDGTKTTASDFEGIYYFQNVPPGKHSLRLVVNSVPIEYIPQIKILQEIELSEGTTYIFHVPLIKNKE